MGYISSVFHCMLHLDCSPLEFVKLIRLFSYFLPMYIFPTINFVNVIIIFQSHSKSVLRMKILCLLIQSDFFVDAVLLVEYLFSHCLHLSSPSSSCHDPIGQGLHLSCPSSSWNQPARHFLHSSFSE